MRLATSQLITAIGATSGGDPAYDPNDLIDYTFNEKYLSGNTTQVILTCVTSADVTYVGIAGHNLGTIGADITIVVNGSTEVSAYAPQDDRALMWTFPAGSGFVISINKPNGTVAVLNHVAAGDWTDFTSTTAHGQTITQDYRNSMPRFLSNIPVKSTTISNKDGAPTATIFRRHQQPIKIDVQNIAQSFALNELVKFQRYWKFKGFFLQQEDDTPTSTMLVNPATMMAAKTHPQTREVVSISLKSACYTGLE